MLFTSYFFLYLVSMLSVGFLIRGFYRNATNAYYFVIPIFIIFYVLPDFIDLLIGQKFLGPSSSPNMYIALSDNKTNIIYNIYVSIVIIFFTFLARKKTRFNIQELVKSSEKILLLYKKNKYLFWLILLLPSLLIIASGEINHYYDYLNRDRSEAPPIHEIVTKVILIANLLAAIILARSFLLIRKYQSYSYLVPVIFAILLVIINCYIHGKRSIVPIYLISQFGLLYITNALSRKKLSIMFIIMILIMFSFLSFYGKNLSDSFITSIQSLRIDFSRDYSLKFVIYNDLLNDNKILPFSGASYLFLLTFFIPRSVYLEKPYPYAVYFTNSSFGNFGGDYLYGWGLTTSFVSESVSNIGWFGLIFFPLFYFVLSSYLDKINSTTTHLIAYIVMILLLVIQPIAIMSLIIVLILLLIKKNKKFVFKRSNP
ncbi:hypothetical protein [Psychrobacter sp.]|uniref:hypothetical protein n=1 Tax=Psychrobacter sp. TaxID=56811 RepID=UPI003F9A15B1